MSFSYLLNEDTCAKVQKPEYFEAIPATKVENLSYEKTAPTGEDRLKFDLVHAPPSYANALRRCLLSWVPSVAIEDVSVYNNSGVMPDEMIAHRLGLIPIDFDPLLLEQINGETDPVSMDPQKTLLFGLNVIGGNGPEADYTGIDSSFEGKLPPTYTGSDGFVTSSHLVWMPFPEQNGRFPAAKPLHQGVPITKLRLGQQIELYARAVRSNGLDHAKYQPVATAFYKYITRIEVDNEQMPQELKQELVSKCPLHVFDIEDSDVVINRSRDCTSCRECIRGDFQKYVKLGKEDDVVEFTVESVGVIPAPKLVLWAFQTLRDRCAFLQQAITQ